MKFGSLFAGIGGFDLGLERSGMTCQWQVEIEDYPTKILEKHWPEVHRERDIKECSGSNLEPVELICGGFPCQDISVAGTGAGLAGERSVLWHEMHRIISDIKPRWVVVENVAALLSRGLDVVLRDLSQIGYDCEWHVISASAVGAPHRRERVWIIANANGVGRDSRGDNREKRHLQRDKKRNASTLLPDRKQSKSNVGEVCTVLPNANVFGTQIQIEGEQPAKQMLERFGWWETEPGVDRVAHGIPRRVDRLKGLGNAVVPQSVELIGRRNMASGGSI